MQDPYCYSGSYVLKNKLNIKSDQRLHEAERRFAKLREQELILTPIHGKFDFNHLKKIHYVLFQDVYDWAGQVRKVDIAKGNIFCLYNLIDANAEAIFTELKKENYLRGYGAGQMIKRLAYYLCDHGRADWQSSPPYRVNLLQ